MSWSRRTILGLAGLPLAGCFRPMLAQDGAASGLLVRIALPEIDGRFGYFLTKRLEDRLGRPEAPEYRLAVRTNIAERGIAVAQDNSVTRVTLTATAEWSLSRRAERTPILQDVATNQSGYNATSSQFATRQVRLDVERRLAQDLAERIARVILARAETISS